METTIKGSLGYLEKNANGRLQLGDRELSCGDVLEVKILRDGRAPWIETRIEHNGTDYYLVGIKEPPEGLIAYIRP